MDFWSEARSQAARECGARHWRMFAALQVARRLWPVVVVPAFGLLVFLGWKWLRQAMAAHEPARLAVWLVLAAALLAGVALLSRVVAQSLAGPPRRRRSGRRRW